MHIGRNDRPLNNPVVGDGRGLAVFGRAISRALYNATKGLHLRAENGSSAVVSRARQYLCQALEYRPTHELTDGMRALRVGRNVQDPKACDAPIARISIPMAQDLQGSVGRERRTPRIEGAHEAGIFAQLLRYKRLGGVLATSKSVDIKASRDHVERASLDDFGYDAVPTHLLLEHDHIIRISVGAQDFGHENPDP